VGTGRKDKSSKKKFCSCVSGQIPRTLSDGPCAACVSPSTTILYLCTCDLCLTMLPHSAAPTPSKLSLDSCSLCMFNSSGMHIPLKLTQRRQCLLFKHRICVRHALQISKNVPRDQYQLQKVRILGSAFFPNESPCKWRDCMFLAFLNFSRLWRKTRFLITWSHTLRLFAYLWENVRRQRDAQVWSVLRSWLTVNLDRTSRAFLVLLG
jgi:hypothetical protein